MLPVCDRPECVMLCDEILWQSQSSVDVTIPWLLCWTGLVSVSATAAPVWHTMDPHILSFVLVLLTIINITTARDKQSDRLSTFWQNRQRSLAGRLNMTKIKSKIVRELLIVLVLIQEFNWTTSYDILFSIWLSDIIGHFSTEWLTLSLV